MTIGASDPGHRGNATAQDDQQRVNRAIFLLSLAAFASAAALRLCDPMLPVLAKAFDTSIGKAALVVTATSVAYGGCQLLFGPLGDRFGKIRVIAWACLALTIGALASALSYSFDALLVARVLTGATTAALIPLSMAWIGDVVAFEQRQPTLAKFMSGQILGLVSGQALGGLFADMIGWRWAFAVLAGSYLAVGALLLRTASHLASGPGGKSSELASGDRGATTLGRIRQVIGTPGVWSLLGTVFVEAMMTFGVLTFAPTFLHQRFAISLFHAGAIVATFGFGGLLYTLFARRWVRMVGQSGLPVMGGVLLGTAFLSLALATTWNFAVVACIVAGLGFYQFHNTLQTQATQLVAAARGTAVSLFAACFFLGQATGVAAGAMIVDSFGPVWLFAASALVLPLLGWHFSHRQTNLTGLGHSPQRAPANNVRP